MTFLLIFMGGGLGSVSRYALMRLIGRIMGNAFPWHTLGVNLAGAFVIGALTQFMASRLSGIETARLLLVTGFLGGFTTFSAFSLEGALMWQRGDYIVLGAYVGASVIGTIVAVLCGGILVRGIL